MAWLTVREVADGEKMNAASVYWHINKGNLKARWTGKHWVVRKADLPKFRSRNVRLVRGGGKSRIVPFRLKVEDYAELEARAKAESLNVSEYVRKIVENGLSPSVVSRSVQQVMAAAGHKGGTARARRHTKAELRRWGKRGGRPRGTQRA